MADAFAQEGAGGGGIRRLRPAAPGAGGPGRSGAAWRRHAAGARPASRARPAGARSQEYGRVLDRYIARLVSRRQLPDALAVYRREIDRNPDDPGLYAAAAQFLEQNTLTAEVEQIYRLAIQQFPDRSWHHRLARWYLRRNQTAAFETLTRDVTRTFEGTDLARYFRGGGRPRARRQRAAVSAAQSVRPRAVPASPDLRQKPPVGIRDQGNARSGGGRSAAAAALVRGRGARHGVLRDALAHEPARRGDRGHARRQRARRQCDGELEPAGERASTGGALPRGGRHLAFALRVGDAGHRRAGGRVSGRRRAQSANRLAAPVAVLRRRARDRRRRPDRRSPLPATIRAAGPR